MNFDTIKPDEVRLMYEQAADKKYQVKILAQLMACEEADVCDILGIPHTKKRTSGRIDEEKALEMHQEGATNQQIADAFGVTLDAIRHWKWRTGLLQQSEEYKQKYSQCKALYDQGLKDKEIAEKTGIKIKSVWDWRKQNKLPANRKRPGKDWSLDDKKLMPLYEKGLTDKQVADICGCNYWNVRDWRQHRGLVHNGPKSKDGKPKKGGRKPLDWGEVDKLCRPLYESGLNDPKIQAATGIDKRTVFAWRKREKLPSQRRRGQLSVKEDELSESRFN